ncbi:hypothetical protein R69746_06966 [Paraburkholderia aspalathi]|uniref:phage tail tape measure protein n=1 Tax=Paraburkholderia aspalathi TaxID=1324617 RepID=UPI00190D9758|nr:hypothetical protein [Paraburkholderia aspalathi]MBK3842948.1 hypothetical protein [Paraburkholderia aspalathi]CAE6841928.1 hypothetical protein R69746_06966 [Paraburkholderia aspalathi]
MDNALKLRVMFDMIDGFTKPLKNMLAGNRGLASSLKETRRELAEMGKTQKAVASFREMRTGLESTGTQLASARGRVKELAGSLRAMGPPSQKMIADLHGAREAARTLTQQQKTQTQAVNELRTKLESAGINTRNLSQHERELRTSIAATTSAMNAQAAKLDQISEREKKVAIARTKMQAMQGVAAGMAVGGYAARSTGMHMLGEMHESLDEAKKYELEVTRIKALGLGDHASADAVKYATAMKTYGTSTTENLTMMRDALTIFADEHHAQMVMPTLTKMKFANEAMFGAEDAHANEEKFMNMLKVIELRGGTKDESTFKGEANMVQKVLTATGGRVGGDEWRNFIQTGGVAAKQMRKDAFYYQMEPLIQEMGGHAVGTGLMSAYSNIYQGKTTVKAANQMMSLDLLDKKKVEYNKIGMIKQIKPGALAGGDLLKASPLEWMEKVLLPKLAAKGITDPDKVKDMIATIFTNRTAANLFTTMYMQKDQIHKNEKLNAGADGIDEATDKGKQLAQGKEIAAKKKLADLKLAIGAKVMPLYTVALEKASVALDRINGFMEKHSTAAKTIIVTLAVLAGALVAAGTLTIALAGVLGPLAILRFGMSTLGTKGGMLHAVLRGLASLLRDGLVRGFMMAARALMLLARLAMANPMLAIIGLLALGALYIWQHWDTLGPKFAKIWDAIKAAFGAAGDWIAVKWTATVEWFKSTFSGIGDWFGSVGSRFMEIGGHLISGLVDGIRNGLGAVKDAITGVADATVGWFKEKLGIHSPSRVFGELGGFISQGAAIGMEGEQGRVAKAAIGLAAAAVTSFGTPALAAGLPFAQAAAVPLVRQTVPIDTRPPLAAAPAAGNGASAAAASSIIVNIYPAAGADPAAIAQAVRAELDRRERSKQSRIGSRLSD